MPETVVTETSNDDFDDAPAAQSDKKFTQSELDRIVADRIAREKAKYADYGDLKKRAAAAMSDHEKSLTEAEARGRSEALTSTGLRLAKSEFRAAAAGKVSTEALDGFLEYADLKRFVGDDGEPDQKAITAAIKKLSSSGGSSSNTNYDGGARTTAERPDDMNAVIRQLKGFG